MDRDFRRGHIEIDFTPEPFVSPVRLVGATLRLFVSRIGLIAAIVLAIFLPGSLALQFVCEVLDIPISGIPFYLLLEALDIVLASLVAPAIVYGVLGGMRPGPAPGILECLRWGRRQFGKTLWNEIKVNITVILWGALLVVPGIVVMIRLVFTDIVVAIEADLEPDPMQRSRQLAQGRWWRLFAVLAPTGLLNMAAMFVILDRPGIVESRILFAAADSVLNVFAQLTTVAALLMYLGIVPRQKKTAKL